MQKYTPPIQNENNSSERNIIQSKQIVLVRNVISSNSKHRDNNQIIDSQAQKSENKNSRIGVLSSQPGQSNIYNQNLLKDQRSKSPFQHEERQLCIEIENNDLLDSDEETNQQFDINSDFLSKTQDCLFKRTNQEIEKPKHRNSSSTNRASILHSARKNVILKKVSQDQLKYIKSVILQKRQEDNQQTQIQSNEEAHLSKESKILVKDIGIQYYKSNEQMQNYLQIQKANGNQRPKTAAIRNQLIDDQTTQANLSEQRLNMIKDQINLLKQNQEAQAQLIINQQSASSVNHQNNHHLKFANISSNLYNRPTSAYVSTPKRLINLINTQTQDQKYEYSIENSHNYNNLIDKKTLTAMSDNTNYIMIQDNIDTQNYQSNNPSSIKSSQANQHNLNQLKLYNYKRIGVSLTARETPNNMIKIRYKNQQNDNQNSINTSNYNSIQKKDVKQSSSINRENELQKIENLLIQSQPSESQVSYSKGANRFKRKEIIKQAQKDYIEYIKNLSICNDPMQEQYIQSNFNSNEPANKKTNNLQIIETPDFTNKIQSSQQELKQPKAYTIKDNIIVKSPKSNIHQQKKNEFVVRTDLLPHKTKRENEFILKSYFTKRDNSHQKNHAPPLNLIHSNINQFQHKTSRQPMHDQQNQDIKIDENYQGASRSIMNSNSATSTKYKMILKKGDQNTQSQESSKKKRIYWDMYTTVHTYDNSTAY